MPRGLRWRFKYCISFDAFLPRGVLCDVFLDSEFFEFSFTKRTGSGIPSVGRPCLKWFEQTHELPLIFLKTGSVRAYFPFSKRNPYCLFVSIEPNFFYMLHSEEPRGDTKTTAWLRRPTWICRAVFFSWEIVKFPLTISYLSGYLRSLSHPYLEQWSPLPVVDVKSFTIIENFEQYLQTIPNLMTAQNWHKNNEGHCRISSRERLGRVSRLPDIYIHEIYLCRETWTCCIQTRSLLLLPTWIPLMNRNGTRGPLFDKWINRM